MRLLFEALHPLVEKALGLVEEAAGRAPGDGAQLLRLIEDVGRFVESVGCGQHDHFTETDAVRLSEGERHQHGEAVDSKASPKKGKSKTSEKKSFQTFARAKNGENWLKFPALFERLGRLMLLSWGTQALPYEQKLTRC